VSETQALLRQLIVQQQGQGGASLGRPEPGRAKKKGRARPTARG
jgi:hypothetical protein